MTNLAEFRNKLLPRRLGVAAKLYLLAALSTLAVAILAGSSLHFARVTEAAAAQLGGKAFKTVESSARLQSLLAQHRQIIESAPAEVDRTRLEASQREFIAKSSELFTLIKQIDRDEDDGVARQLEEQITDGLPALIRAGQEVMFYAYNFAQDKALESAAAYARVADDLEEKIHRYRSHQIAVANATVSALFDGARALLFWVSISAFVALVMIGPLGLAVMRGVLSRLDRITRYMTRLAGQPLAEEVPSRGDRDELGDMARALQVFKENGAELLERKLQLEQVNDQLDLALNNMTHGLCMFDANGRLIVCNQRYTSMYDVPVELTRAGTPLRAILQYLVEKKTFAEPAEETFAAIDSNPPGGSFRVVRPLTDGRLIAISHQSTADGGWVAIHEDITERQRAEAHIAHLARHDHLTDLPNRVFFREELDKCVRRLRKAEKFAILCLDLDRFKSVNDSLGHSIGDKLLGAVAGRLAGCVEEQDFVARLGGDEFAVIQSNVVRPEESGVLAGRIIERVGAPYEIEGQELNVGVSIGIAIAPADGKDADHLLKNADLAMYRAKADGRGSYCFFEPGMDARIQARRALETELRNALTDGQLQLFYQPVVNAASGKVQCFEALLRWFHPRLGAVPPSEFVPLAEESGLIGPLGQWVLRSACAEAAKWPAQFRIAVNLSPIQFKNTNLVNVIVGALAASGLPPSRLELEITESLLLEADPKNIAILHELRALGIHIVMDDFGTGFSSLNYLRSFPFDKIKIDKSFVNDIAKRGESMAIVKAIIDLARALDIAVVAEGVETEEQLKRLVAEGCNEVQGYYFSKPAAIENFEKILYVRNGRIELAA
jgi:diguanylate cyclase (GGDEF)-like protein